MTPASRPQPIEVEVSIPSDVGQISPLVDRLTHLIELAGCVPGEEIEVEMALREALNNAVLHGNRSDPRKRVHVYCGCDPSNGVSLSVRDEGDGFDPNEVPGPTIAEALYSNGRRGIFIMKYYMDEVSFERGGTEVHLLKRAARRQHQRRGTTTAQFPPIFSNSTEHAAALVGAEANPFDLQER